MTRYRNLIDWQTLDGLTIKIEVTKETVFAIIGKDTYEVIAKVVHTRAPKTMDTMAISHEDRASVHLADEEPPF